ncbi:MAG TPA: hypothetical protein VMZ04_04230, partial [Anaerolineae bacterium]|nr:hypothetical protein [Anaerolineae bacterium]
MNFLYLCNYSIFSPLFKRQFIFILISLLTGLSEMTGAVAAEESPFAKLSGENTFPIGLKEAIFQALEHNPMVTIQRLEPEVSRTYASEQREAFDPDFSMSVNQNRTKLQRFLGTNPNPINMTWDRF